MVCLLVVAKLCIVSNSGHDTTCGSDDDGDSDEDGGCNGIWTSSSCRNRILGPLLRAPWRFNLSRRWKRREQVPSSLSGRIMQVGESGGNVADFATASRKHDCLFRPHHRRRYFWPWLSRVPLRKTCCSFRRWFAALTPRRERHSYQERPSWTLVLPIGLEWSWRNWRLPIRKTNDIWIATSFVPVESNLLTSNGGFSHWSLSRSWCSPS